MSYDDYLARAEEARSNADNDNTSRVDEAVEDFNLLYAVEGYTASSHADGHYGDYLIEVRFDWRGTGVLIDSFNHHGDLEGYDPALSFTARTLTNAAA